MMVWSDLPSPRCSCLNGVLCCALSHVTGLQGWLLREQGWLIHVVLQPHRPFPVGITYGRGLHPWRRCRHLQTGLPLTALWLDCLFSLLAYGLVDTIQRLDELDHAKRGANQVLGKWKPWHHYPQHMGDGPSLGSPLQSLEIVQSLKIVHSDHLIKEAIAKGMIASAGGVPDFLIYWQVEAKYPALLFKQQLDAFVQKIFPMLRDNVKKEITPQLAACIHAPRAVTTRSRRGSVPPASMAESAGSPGAHPARGAATAESSNPSFAQQRLRPYLAAAAHFSPSPPSPVPPGACLPLQS